MPEASSISTVRVACAQLVARDLGDGERAIEEALEAIGEAASARADVVVLPECTYPAYILADPTGDIALRPDSEVEQVFAATAAGHGLWLAVGLAQGWRRGERRAANAALLFGPDGQVHLRTGKRFLWDFDRRWFAPAGHVDPAPWPGPGSRDRGSIGLLVCADARMPEIARSLAVLGARLILDPTAWVAAGREPSAVSNLQPEFLMGVRALENGVWIAAADKAGMERGAVAYAGRSCIVAPDGSIVAMASADEPEVIWADVDLARAAGPPIPRRPELYAAISEDGSSSPAAVRAATAVIASDAVVRIGVMQSTLPMDAASADFTLHELASTVQALGLQMVGAVVRGSGDPVADTIALDLGVAVVTGITDDSGRIDRVEAVAGGHKAIALPTHGVSADPGSTLDERTFDVGPLRVGILIGAEGLVPEASRIVTLQGAELQMWLADAGTARALDIARARAVENRTWFAFILPADTGESEAVSAVIDPDGRVSSIGLQDRDHLVTGVVNVATARLKQMAPGTDVLRDRQPATYQVLTARAVTTP